MSGLASHGRGVTKGVLRRSVSNPVNIPAGIINEVMQRGDNLDPCRSIWARNDSDVALAKSNGGNSEVISDFKSLEQAISDMEEYHVSSQRCFDQIESIMDNAPLLSSSPRQGVGHSSPLPVSSSTDASISAASVCAATTININSAVRGSHNPLPDSPIFSAFQRELTMLRGELNDDRRAYEGSPPRPSTPPQSIPSSSNQLLQSQLDEARASNRMVQRALAAVQVELLAPKTSRVQNFRRFRLLFILYP